MNIAIARAPDRMLRTVADRLNPVHAALAVIDMQNDFCAEGGYVETVIGRSAGPCRAAVPAIMALVRAARAARVPVFWIKANYDPDTLPAGMAAHFAKQGQGRICCGSGSWGAEFFGVEPGEGEAVIEKHCFSGFMGTDLDTRLRSLAIRSLVFAGVQTNVCVEATLRDALARGFHVIIAEDCVASHTPALHEATLTNVRLAMGDALPGAAIASHWPAAA